MTLTVARFARLGDGRVVAFDSPSRRPDRPVREEQIVDAYEEVDRVAEVISLKQRSLSAGLVHEDAVAVSGPLEVQGVVEAVVIQPLVGLSEHPVELFVRIFKL